MEAAEGRRVRSGDEYDHLFPRADGKNSTIKKDASVKDTVKLIQSKVPATLHETKTIAGLLQGRTLEETCRRIWTFPYKHIPYARDEKGIEQVRSPARTWRDRKVPNREGKVGVDCDCFSVFVGSCLMNLGVRFKYRITKYPKDYPEVPTWQHIYIVVPKDGKVDYPLDNREDYIVIDCVKDAYDSEQPFFEYKDYNDMKLEFLSGTDDEREEYKIPNITDVKDIASIYDDEEELAQLGKFSVKKIAGTVKKGMRVLNRFTNPATILLRNGFLLCMKINLLHVAGRLRYAYLTDAQALALGVNMSILSKVRKIKDKAEKIFFGAGGKIEHLKKAILTGKGNKNRQVPLSGLSGLGDADGDEYRILTMTGFGDLGDPVDGSAIAAAMSVMTALAASLKQVKGLFKSGTPQAKSFNSDTEPVESATASSGADQSITPIDQDTTTTVSQNPPSFAQKAQGLVNNFTNTLVPQSSGTPDQSGGSQDLPAVTQDTNNATQNLTNNPAAGGSRVPAQSSDGGGGDANDQALVQTNNSDAAKPDDKKDNFFQKATTWVKENPGKTLLIAGIVAGGTYFLLKSKQPQSRPQAQISLGGIPKGKKAKKKKVKKPMTKRTTSLKAINI